MAPKKAKKQTQQQKPNPASGFSLIELMIACAVVLVLVAGLVAAGGKALAASRETSAAQSMQSFANDVNIYQKNWGGFPLLAADMGSPATPTPAGACTDDEEITPQSAAAAYDAGFVSGGYTFKFMADPANQYAASGGSTCTSQVSPGWELMANPTAVGTTKGYCSDQTGNFYIPGGTVAVNTGIGCLQDNTTALAMGQ